MGQLDGKVCIVTGAAGSIGADTARLMLAEGGKVMLVDKSAEGLERLAAGLPTERIATAIADVAQTEQVKAFVDATVAKWGAIDVLFSNAGNDGPLIPTVDYPEDIFDQIIATHVRGCFLVCKYTLPKMKDGGSVVITSSITGVKGVAGNCSYVAAKHALVGLMRCLAKEMAPRRIRVNTVNPGPIDNEFMRTAERSMSKMLGRDAGAMFDQIIPLGRHGRVEEVARAVLFLASDQSSYTTGSTLMVDGALCA
jgi:NAD(P)-dependent dehydrogenase (short-subunit alcohol dehydrogenase family)